MGFKNRAQSGGEERGTQQLPDPLSTVERRDWELWSIALILLTAFAGGVIAFLYWSTHTEQKLSGWFPHLIWLLLFGLIALVLLLNVYLIGQKRTLSKLWRQILAQEVELELHRAHAATDSHPLASVIEDEERREKKSRLTFRAKEQIGQTKSYVNELIQQLDSIDFESMQKATWVLGEATDPSAIKTLVFLLKGSSAVRAHAVSALKKISAENETAATELAITLLKEQQGRGATEAGAREIAEEDRRRSPRILLEIPVVVRWTDKSGQSHMEMSSTKVVNAYGALLTLKNPVSIGLELELVNATTQGMAKARVVWVGDLFPEGMLVGIELGEPDPDFWHGEIA